MGFSRQTVGNLAGSGTDDLYLSVNISVQDQYYLDVYDVFTRLVEKYDLDPHKLKLEITETLFVTEMENHRYMLERLQAYGFEIEIDDFGSGYSSLNILKDIKADVIKIDMEFLQETVNVDRSLVDLIGADPPDRAVTYGCDHRGC